jgi:hypothetical protein
MLLEKEKIKGERKVNQAQLTRDFNLDEQHWNEFFLYIKLFVFFS